MCDGDGDGAKERQGTGTGRRSGATHQDKAESFNEAKGGAARRPAKEEEGSAERVYLFFGG